MTSTSPADDGTSQPPASEQQRLVGTLLAVCYRIDRVVAQGGFGVVYAGHPLALDMPIAVKVLRTGGASASDADKAALFVDEARTLSARWIVRPSGAKFEGAL